MNCPYCGAQNPEGSTVCSTCGQQLTAPAAPPSTPPAPGQQYAPAAYPQVPAAPPAYGQPQYAPGYGQSQPEVKSHLVLSILATLFCCLPFGVVGIVFASQVSSKLAAGDWAGAQKASKNAALWSWLAIGAGALMALVYAGVVLLAVISDASSY